MERLLKNNDNNDVPCIKSLIVEEQSTFQFQMFSLTSTRIGNEGCFLPSLNCKPVDIVSGSTITSDKKYKTTFLSICAYIEHTLKCKVLNVFEQKFLLTNKGLPCQD